MRTWFEKIFSKKKAAATPPKAEQKEVDQRQLTHADKKAFERFEQEMNAYIKRYYSDPHAQLNLNILNDQEERIPPAVVFSDRYFEWAKAKTAWDKKSVIFKLFDQLFRQKLKMWQLAERFTEDRFADDALGLLESASVPRVKAERYFAAKAKALMVLGRYKEAIAAAMKGVEANTEFHPTKLLLADAHYLAGEKERALQIYNAVAAQVLPRGEQKQMTAISLLGFEGQKMRSPVYALMFLQEFPVTEGIWKWAEIEFYYSPYFRYEYGLALLKSGDKMRAFSKWLDLAKEMPWVDYAALAAMECFEALDPKGNKKMLVEDRKWLKQHIRTHKWKQHPKHSIKEFLVDK